MKLSKKILISHVHIIRDAAISMEKQNINLALRLMQIALILRPTGKILIKKIKEYKAQSVPEISPEELNDFIIREAVFELEYVNISSALLLAQLASKLFPNDGELNAFIAKYAILQDIVIKNKRLEKQVELLRNKFNQIHEALIYSKLLQVKEVGDPIANLSPIEIIDKGADKTLIVFGGMALNPTMPPKEFFRSFSNRKINIIFVKDFKQCWYQNGLIGITTDIPSTVEYLKELIPKTTSRLICIGTSAGGYAAIRFGVDLNADRIIAFAPQTIITNKIFQRFQSFDSRIQEIDLNSPDFDLKKFLENRSPSNIEIHYGAKNEHDSFAAKHVNDFATIHHYDTASHGISLFLKQNNMLEAIFESI